MRKVIVNYGGAIIFYLAIFFTIVIVNARFDYLNNNNNLEITYAYSD